MSNIFKRRSLDGSVISDAAIGKGLPGSVEFLIALAGVAVLFPVLITCAMLVRKSSPGEIIFRQHRVGRGSNLFTLYKFRTMICTADGPSVTAATDGRITPIGKFLRKWKLDELPELYNVLRGDMSFVGPRPEVPELVDLSNPAWNIILQARPGITDPVTLTLRNEEALLATVEDKEAFYAGIVQPFKIRGYLEYLETKGVITDLIIMAQSLKVIVFPYIAPENLSSVFPTDNRPLTTDR